jgi:antitoxin ParD1/3/4
MNISLNPHFEKFIAQKVKSGSYNSASEVVREGLRLMMEREILLQKQLVHLNQAIHLGLTQLEKGQGLLGEEAFQDIRALSKDRKSKESDPL